MFAIAVLGFVVNLCLMAVLGHGHGHSGHGHSHGGGHGHALRRVVDADSCGGGHGHGHGGQPDDPGDHTERGHGDAALACEEEGNGGQGHESASLAMRGAIVHVIGDTVQSLGVIVAAVLIWWRPFNVGFTANGVSKWNYADPCCTILFGILVLITTRSALFHSLTLVMIRAPAHIDQGALLDKLGKCPGVHSVHDLHVWTVGSKDVMCTAHLMVEGTSNAMPALIAAIKVAKSMGIVHSTFQTEIVGLFHPALETYGIHDNPLSMARIIGKRPAEDASRSQEHSQADADGREAARHDEGRGHGHAEHGDEGGHGHSHG